MVIKQHQNTRQVFGKSKVQMPLGSQALACFSSGLMVDKGEVEISAFLGVIRDGLSCLGET
jgi:hypothetical protein